MDKVVILSRDQLENWDNFVQSHPFGWLCHLSSWQRVLSSCVRIKFCYFLAIVDEPSGRIAAGLPVYETKSLTLNKKLISAPLTTIFDPLVSNREQLAVLLSRMLSLLRSTRSSKLVIKTLHAGKLWEEMGGTKDNSFRYHYLDLSHDLDTIWKKAHRSCVRQHVNKAVQKGVEVRQAEDKKDLSVFYRLYSATRKRHGLPSIPFSYFEAIWDIYRPQNCVYFLLACYKRSAICSLMAFKFKDKFSAEALGWDDHFRWLTPSAITFWEAIKLAKQLGCRQFDFGRTSLNNENLIRFKRHWGSEEIEMPQYIFGSDKINSRGNPQDSLVRNSSLATLIKCCPDSVYNLFSRFYYYNFAG
ncbi:MAG TPA: peptidoglycan bridge formation glycyltransferase FemA/FemB family protein [Candidatus Saccharicenans sp.]|nr:peptidoglycan bridge formation glycyltransferase FemA/FemB family protein [Candidatus Saccharicenans sp.]